MDAANDVMAVALLAEPTRQRLYLYLRERHEPVGREEAAQHVGITARLAGFHLDKMADAGLLDFEYRRISGRSGPGAGHPAKLYSISSRSFSVVIPQTRYALAASMMAAALSTAGSEDGGAESLQDIATTVGKSMGDEIRREAHAKGSRQEAIRRKLMQLGYEPRVRESGEWTLHNCIFSELSHSHRELVCGMNAALVAGLVGGAHVPSLHVEKRTGRPNCCVRLVSR
jgi:predicted ArsR family transcriptional regulator